jgi:hypothetical protein
MEECVVTSVVIPESVARAIVAGSVTWLVRESPLVCETCRGTGRKVYANTSYRGRGIGGQMMTTQACDGCNGTGRPSTVEILSDQTINGKPMMEPEHHGTVTLGEPVPVVGTERAARPPRYVYLPGNGAVMLAGTSNPIFIDITDALGDQHIEPGCVAYPVAPT